MKRAIEVLELDEVQHSISAIHDESVVRFLADHHINLNMAPSSNILLGRVPSMSDHPIGRLWVENQKIGNGGLIYE